MTSGMQTTKRLLLVAGAALITAGQVNGFGVKTHSRFAAVKNLPAAPLHALFMDCDTDDKPCSPDRGDDSSINNRHSASDWHYNVMSLPKSSVLRDIRNPVLTIAVWSGIVSVFQQILASSSSRMLRTMASDMCIGATPHSFLVSSLGLLLVFRTNTAYQRFYVSPLVVEDSRNDSRFVTRESFCANHESYYRKDARFGKIFYPFPGISPEPLDSTKMILAVLANNAS